MSLQALSSPINSIASPLEVLTKRPEIELRSRTTNV